MKLLIERYNYEQHQMGTPVYAALYGSGLVSDHELNGVNPISLDYVGYFYNRECEDVVFILPKVVLTGESHIDESDVRHLDTVFGFSPEKLLDFQNCFKKEDKHIQNFLSELSIWLYKAINIYRENNPDSNILCQAEYINDYTDRHKEKYHTLFDVILALREFNQENKNLLTFITRCNHSGKNKINWKKTVSKNNAFFLNQTPVYLNPLSNKQEANMEEELIIIYYSILNYVKLNFGFSFEINFNYPIIEGNQFKSLCETGKGLRKLKNIKYKYFSDKLIKLWNLCYSFFNFYYEISIKKKNKDYLLARSFEIIFERMIDELLGDKIVERGLKEQRDNKRIDHIFVYESLIKSSQDQDELNTYYISDSKYYSRKEIEAFRNVIDEFADSNDKSYFGIRLNDSAIYKQFTYARNVIQWNLDLFFHNPKAKHLRIRPDSLTEGYNIIPNFFISAYIPIQAQEDEKANFDFQNDNLIVRTPIEYNRHFENRLFDRDTLLLSYFDVNFLFIVSLYGRNNKHQQNEWKVKVKKKLREIAQKQLIQLYDFYVLKPKYKGWEQIIKSNFHDLNGKIYRSSEKSEYLILALQKTKDAKIKFYNKHSIDVISLEKEERKIRMELEGYFEFIKVKNLDDISTMD